VGERKEGETLIAQKILARKPAHTAMAGLLIPYLGKVSLYNAHLTSGQYFFSEFLECKLFAIFDLRHLSTAGSDNSYGPPGARPPTFLQTRRHKPTFLQNRVDGEMTRGKHKRKERGAF
jgi:hypothetical protein